MRRYQLGNSGEGVREIQERLSALGHGCDRDRPGEFGEATLAAVKAFQRTRSLPATGVVGQESWRALYEAGYRLGDRLLFLRRPMLRGDDVAELQSRLDALGFDTGKPDGIFGPQTERGLRDFQFNRGLAIDGISGPEVITELRLVARGEMRAGRVTLREREWLRSRPSTLVGARIY
ncbi:MAG: peptidoglycan-binding protein, partial [Acidimicrobiia bacterium]|nr:peptidoglycan-binding protein [Acidimicrobiia bacterium]